jgi:glycyl-tRNA synthetase
MPDPAENPVPPITPAPSSPVVDRAGAKSMDDLMSLCKRRGFIYQASEIYGGINGFWDYGPLGAQLKKNLRDAWWQDMIMNPCWGRRGPSGERVRVMPVETCIIQHPNVWEASGHVGGFNDPMVDCRESKKRYRADHLACLGIRGDREGRIYAYVTGDTDSLRSAKKKLEKEKRRSIEDTELDDRPFSSLSRAEIAVTVGPDAKEPGSLTEPRAFNLMFRTYVGATATDDDVAYLRPETAQGIFVQFKNVVDTTRVRVPFGIGNTGKSFRNEVTPRNFTFRSREFEQMELEFFCHPSESMEWFTFWRQFRMEWWQSLGLAGDNLRLYDTPKKDLAHYAMAGSDVEYRFPFTYPDFGELEGIAHRGDFDLKQHQEHSRTKLDYFDQDRGEPLPNGSKKGERYLPHVIEPAAGLDRGVLAVLCEAYTKDASRPSPEIMRFHPRLAPIKAAVFPLVNKEGMPEVAERLHDELHAKFGRSGFIETDAKQSIGKRYARMDEAGCPWCFTVDGQTLTDQTVTARDRDTGRQERIGLDKAGAFLGEKLGS